MLLLLNLLLLRLLLTAEFTSEHRIGELQILRSPVVPRLVRGAVLLVMAAAPRGRPNLGRGLLRQGLRDKRTRSCLGPGLGPLI